EFGWVSRFCETNVRTYVRDRAGRAGIWFFSLDAARLGAVVAARTTYRLPYFWSDMQITGSGDNLTYRCRRRLPGPRDAASEAEISLAPRSRDEEVGDRDHSLPAGWILSSVSGSRYRLARPCHDPWPLHRAQVRRLDDRLISAAGLPQPAGEPLAHYSPG